MSGSSNHTQKSTRTPGRDDISDLNTVIIYHLERDCTTDCIVESADTKPIMEGKNKIILT